MVSTALQRLRSQLYPAYMCINYNSTSNLLEKNAAELIYAGLGEIVSAAWEGGQEGEGWAEEKEEVCVGGIAY